MPRIVKEPQIYHVFERTQRKPDPAPLELPVVLVAPHKQVFDPFDSTGTPKAAGKLGDYTWPNSSAGVFAQKGAGAEYLQFDVPGVEAGAKLEELDLWAVQGVGTSQAVAKLRSSEDETVLATQTSVVATLTPATSPDGFSFTLQDSSINFYRLLGQHSSIVYPDGTNDAELSEGKWATVRIGGRTGGPFYVSAAPTAANPYSLSLRSLGYAPIYTQATVSYELIIGAREFDMVAGPVAARTEFAGYATSRLTALRHMKLVQPGTATITTDGGGHAAVLVLTVTTKGGMTDEQTITLTNVGGASKIVGIDVAGDGVGGTDFVADISGDTTAAQVADTLAQAIQDNGTFDAFVHPVNTDQVVVRQIIAGLTGNKVATATAGYDVFQNAPDDPANVGLETFAIFDGGSATAGTSYTFKNVSDKPVRITFLAPTANAVVSDTHPGYTVTTEYVTTGFKLPDNATASVYELNALLATETEGGPRCYIEPSSIDTWLDLSNSGTNPTRTLSQLLVATGTSLAGVTFTTDQAAQPAGQILVPAATVRRFILQDRLVGAFKTTDTTTISFDTNDRGSIAAAYVGATNEVKLTIPFDAGTVPIGRDVSSTAVPLHELALEKLNTAIHAYYQTTVGYQHAPTDVLRLISHPDDQGFLTHDDTDWYGLPALAGIGIDAASTASTLPSIYSDVSGQKRLASPVLTPALPSYIAKVNYRTTGTSGNALNVGFLYKINSGTTEDLAITNANGEFLITLPTDAAGVPVAEVLSDLATLLDTKNAQDEYTYPIKITEVVDATTGAITAPGTAYAGWNALKLEGLTLREVGDYTTTVADGAHKLKSLLYTNDRADTLGGSSAAAVARIDDTLRGIGSLGTIPLYAEYVALRTDSSPVASLAVHGRSPDLVRVRSTDIDTVVGVQDSRNPMRVIVDQFFSTANANTVYIIGVDETSTTDTWGTEAAYDKVWELLLRRNGYHHFFFSDALWTRTWMTTKVTSLGGEIASDGTVSFLKKSGYFYIPEKITETGTDASVSVGSEVELVTDNGVDTLVNSNANVISDGVVAGDIFISLGSTAAGVITLQDGRKGWKIKSVDNANPSRFTIDAYGMPANLWSTPGDPEPWEIIRPGASLRDASNNYLADAAKDSMVALHTTEGTYHRRIQKHVANSYTDLFGGVRQTFDGIYLMAQYAGIIARTKDEMPSSLARYSSTVENLEGVRAFFNDAQIEVLAGVGLTFAQQKRSPDGPTSVYRDVTTAIASSDPKINTRTFQRRGSQIVEDLLVLRINQRIQPRMAQALLTLEFLDSISSDVDSIMQWFRDQYLFKALNLVSIKFIDDAIRTAYGLDDTGLLIIWEYTHIEEVGALIFRHIVSNE